MFPHRINLQYKTILRKSTHKNINIGCAQRDEYDTWDINLIFNTKEYVTTENVK